MSESSRHSELVNSVPLSDRTTSGTPYAAITWVIIKCAMVDVLWLLDGIAITNLVKQSLNVIMYSFPREDGSGPIMSTATICHGFKAPVVPVNCLRGP